MSLICTECKHIFDIGEESHWTESHGEKMTGCPMCNGAYVEAEHCRHCYGDFLEDDLYFGYCEECLRELVTYDVFWLYLVERDLVADFMFGYLWKSDVPDKISDDLRNILDYAYHALAMYEKQFRKDNLMKVCEAYIFDDECNIYDFAEWIEAKDKEGIIK